MLDVDVDGLPLVVLRNVLILGLHVFVNHHFRHLVFKTVELPDALVLCSHVFQQRGDYLNLDRLFTPRPFDVH